MYEYHNGTQYIYVNILGSASLLGVLSVLFDKILIDFPIIFVIGELAEGRYSDAIKRAKEEMYIVRRHYAKLSRMSCQFTWPKAPEIIHEQS